MRVDGKKVLSQLSILFQVSRRLNPIPQEVTLCLKSSPRTESLNSGKMHNTCDTQIQIKLQTLVPLFDFLYIQYIICLTFCSLLFNAIGRDICFTE